MSPSLPTARQPSAQPLKARRLRGRLGSLAWALLQGAAWAQDDPAAPPLNLRSSTLLQEQISEEQRQQLPTFISGQRLSGRPDRDAVLEGDAMLRRGNTVIRADRMTYDQPGDLARASGRVRVNRAGNVFEGPELELKVEKFEGFFLQPRYQFLKNGTHGEADRVDFIDDKHAIVRNASYTSCQRRPGPSWLPDWVLRASSIHLDQEQDVGVAEDAVLRFKDVPILPIPAISFPLSDQRKSGVLPPTIGLHNINGLELTLPYYWNLAPQHDVTFYPTLMSRRGVDLGTEFRYLEPTFRGQARLDVMPDDKLRERLRWGLSTQHEGTWQTGLAAIGALGLNLKLTRVSDDNYWRDFKRSGSLLQQRLLPNDGALSWSQGNFAVNARALKWQTLQDVGSPIIPPYDRMPQLTARYARAGLAGFEVALEADTTRFEADGRLTNQPNAQRDFVLGRISRPWLAPWGFLTPKLQLHATHYQFDSAFNTGAAAASRNLPTFSLDSGLLLERETSFFGRAVRQTLEPRAFYVRTPFRDQSGLPNYDSGANDFNFATVYTENAFVGHDRIADNNLLTLGVTTRLLDADTGAEALRLGMAQRFRFSDQNVTLPGVAPVSERLSDILLGASVNWDPRWGLDSGVQFNPKTGHSIRTTVGARYLPAPYRVLNVAYRMQRETSEQIDLGWQWPINDLWGDKGLPLAQGQGQGAGRWYSVGRLNYSLQDHKLVDTILGVEYDGGCWLGRAVLERLQNSTVSAGTRILFQLEFVGFSRIGASPLQALRNNIPRYQYLREDLPAPSRFSNYD